MIYENELEKISQGNKGYFHLLLFRVFWVAFHLGRKTKIIPTEEDANKYIVNAAKEEIALENKWYEEDDQRHKSSTYNWRFYSVDRESRRQQAYKEAREL